MQNLYIAFFMLVLYESYGFLSFKKTKVFFILSLFYFYQINLYVLSPIFLNRKIFLAKIQIILSLINWNFLKTINTLKGSKFKKKCKVSK